MSLNIASAEFQDIQFPPQECVICFEKLNETDELILWQCLQCRVKIHPECIKGLLTPICPCCRKEFVNKNSTIITIRSPPSYDVITTIPPSMFYINNELLKIKLQSLSIFIITGMCILILTTLCIFFILPALLHPEMVYNFTDVK